MVQAAGVEPGPAPTLGPCEMFVGKPYVIGRDPDCGLTDAQIDAKRDAAWDAQMARYREWIASDYVRTVDPRTLSQVETLGNPVPGWASLAESVKHADVAVLGRVEKTTFVEGGTKTVFHVERAVKGNPETNLTIHQAPSIRPAYGGGKVNYELAELTINPEGPFLFENDRAVLLLEKDDKIADRYYIQPFSGHYLSAEGRVHSVALNQFHDVDGLSENALMDRTATYVESGAARS